MKKEIKEKVIEFKKKEEELLQAINKNPQDSKLKADLMKLKNEVKKWLGEVGGISSEMSQEEIAQLEMMTSSAERAIFKAAKYNAELTEYITQSAKRAREIQPGYERVIEDKGQMASIAEHNAIDKVRAIDKVNRKRNKKSFLNIVICKFKKSKQQQQEQESDGPSQR